MREGFDRRQFLSVSLSAGAGLLIGGAVGTAIAEEAPKPAGGVGSFFIGAATADITPTEPVALAGQFRLRIATTAETPLAASVVVLESREGDRSLDQAVMVSCDVCFLPAELVTQVRDAVHRRVPDLDAQKVILNATHTHTAPVLQEDSWYNVPKTGVMQVDAYCRFFAERVAEAVEKAWKGRKPGSVTWGLGHAVVAQNRRVTYADGHTVMYGQTNRPDFRGLEGYEDHDVGTLFFWNDAGKLAAIAVNVPCPSQEVEGLSVLHADFWHPVRESLRKRYGSEVCVLGWTSAAGDESPHVIYRKSAEERMRELRKLSRLEEIARRIVAAVDEVYEVVKEDRHAKVPLVHHVETLQLPMRLVTDEEYAAAKAARDESAAQMAGDPSRGDGALYAKAKWHEKVVKRYEEQKTNPQPTRDMELHVLRIGDVVVCTNCFELFTDYGIQIKARSKAVQTFLIQLTGACEGYLPTPRAIQGGGYSAIPESGTVGPEGGQVLVERTVEAIDTLWGQ